MTEKPIYLTLMTQYIDRIESGELKTGDSLPSETQLSALHGVSNITARRVLNELSRRGYAVRERGRGTFVAPQGASARHRKMRIIALVLPYDNEKTKSVEVIRELSSALGKMGYYLSIHITDDDERVEAEILRRSVADGVEGIILYSASSMSNVRLLLELGVRQFPLVMLDRRFDAYPIPSVTSDNTRGSQDITQYLIDRGHRRIVYVATRAIAVTTSARERYQGYLQAMYRSGMPIEGDSLQTITNEDIARYRAGDGTVENINALLALLRGDDPVTGLVCEHDPFTCELMDILTGEGIAIPEQVSIVGFDNLPLTEKLFVPLTTVDQDFVKMARTALDMLMKQIDGGMPDPAHRLIATRVIERASVAELTNPNPQ